MQQRLPRHSQLQMHLFALHTQPTMQAQMMPMAQYPLEAEEKKGSLETASAQGIDQMMKTAPKDPHSPPLGTAQ